MFDIKSTIIRRPEPFEMDLIYLAGFDVWADSMSREAYLNDCRSSQKYQQGNWWVLEHAREIVSSLIVYRDVFGLENGFVGIGSITTPPNKRRHGFALELLRQVLEVESPSATNGFFLFSEVKPEFYGKLGFKILPKNLQKYPDSICMVKCSEVVYRQLECGERRVPRYF